MTNNKKKLIKNKERFCYSLEYIYLIVKSFFKNNYSIKLNKFLIIKVNTM